MATTYWQEAFYTNAPIGTLNSQLTLIGDIFEAHEIKEYTILAIEGWHQFRSGTLSSNTAMAFGIRVQEETLDAAESPDPMENHGSPGEDQDPFWMMKGYAAFDSTDDQVRAEEHTWTTKTRRVVRATEALEVMIQAVGSTDCTFSIACRILILVK